MNNLSPRGPRFLKYILFFLVVAGVLLLLFVNSNLAAIAEMVHPGAGLWTHIALLALETLSICWFWSGLFRGPKHLLLVDASTPEAQKSFEKELKRRMASNPHIKKANLSSVGADGKENPKYLDRCMEILKQTADAEIKSNAKRVFLATALSQNGRLDALIVFIALCRLVWRVSSIYNQRPHPKEILSLYWAIASTTFLAFSIEELDIATEITVGFGEALHATVPAGFTASIPFAGSMLQTFTASTIDGTANGYLALRAGIITRNAYSYAWRLGKKPSRADVFKEAGALLMGMSQELVGKVATSVATSLTSAAKNVFTSAGDRTIKTGKGLMEGIGKVKHDIGAGAGKIATGTITGAAKIATGTITGAAKIATGTAEAMDKLASGVIVTAAKVSSGAEKVITGTANAVQLTRGSSASARDFTGDKVRSPAQKSTPEEPVREQTNNKTIEKQEAYPQKASKRSDGEQDKRTGTGRLRRLFSKK